LKFLLQDKKDDGVVEVIKENIKGKNEADVEEVIKLLNQQLAQPDKPVRRGSGRRAPRTRSLCTATDLEKQQPASKIEPEENNNDPVKVIMDVIPSTPAFLSEVQKVPLSSTRLKLLTASRPTSLWFFTYLVSFLRNFDLFLSLQVLHETNLLVAFGYAFLLTRDNTCKIYIYTRELFGNCSSLLLKSIQGVYVR
jgi:hypothetical protein